MSNPSRSYKIKRLATFNPMNHVYVNLDYYTSPTLPIKLDNATHIDIPTPILTHLNMPCRELVEQYLTTNRSDQEAAVAAYAQAALTAFGEVEAALDQGKILKRRQAALQDASTAADTALQIANVRYKEGETDLTDVLSIQ